VTLRYEIPPVALVPSLSQFANYNVDEIDKLLILNAKVWRPPKFSKFLV
jgi:hypothetical protein